jgi:hypothetical protein
MLRHLPLVFILILPLHLACTRLAHTRLEAAKETPFARIVETNFSKWDLNHDGKLSLEETDKLVGDRAIGGEEAAAVASIHYYLRNQKQSETLSLAMLTHRAGEKASHALAVDTRYRGFRSHIAKAPRELFVGNAPSLAGFSQGHLGDCYFVSAVGAAVARSPDAVKSMFNPNPDGSCWLTFANGRRVYVSRLSDAEIALGSSAGSQGLWLNVLEKGFGQVKIRTSKKVHYGEIGLDAIATGGNADDTIELLSGHRGTYLSIRRGKGKAQMPPAEDRIPLLMAELRQMFFLARTIRPLLCCGTSHYSKLPPGIAGGHDYAILGFDQAREEVLVWNPWGNHYTPKGAPGLQHGYAVKGGKFAVPLNDFVRIFEEVYYESAVPARR